MKQIAGNRILLLAFIGVLLYIFYLQACGGRKCPPAIPGDKTTITEYIYQTDTVWLKKSVPILVKETSPSRKMLDSMGIDSAATGIALDYYTERDYADTVQDDTIAIFTRTTVRENQIRFMETGYRLKIPLVTNTITYNTKPRVQVFVSGNFGTNLKGFIVGPEVMIKDKRNFLYKAGVDFNTTGDTYYRAGFGFMLSFRKK